MSVHGQVLGRVQKVEAKVDTSKVLCVWCCAGGVGLGSWANLWCCRRVCSLIRV